MHHMQPAVPCYFRPPAIACFQKSHGDQFCNGFYYRASIYVEFPGQLTLGGHVLSSSPISGGDIVCKICDDLCIQRNIQILVRLPVNRNSLCRFLIERGQIYPSSVLFYDPSAGCDVCFEKRGSGPTARTPSVFSPYGDPNPIYILSRAEQPGQQPVLRSAHGTENRIHSLSLPYGRTLRKTDLRRARRRYRT